MWNSSQPDKTHPISLVTEPIKDRDMANRINNPCKPRRRTVSYALMQRFSELLICGRCFSHQVRKPVRQLFSSHHKPLALCHDCSRKLRAEHKAQVVRLN
jgi:hypothetical protein